MSNQEKSPEEKQAEARLRELDAQIELLNAKADRLKANAEVGGKKILDDIRRERDALAKKLENARKSTGSALEELGEGFNKAVDDIAASVQQAMKHVKKDEKA